MKKTTILLCVFALSFQQSFAVGLNSEVLAKRTNLHRLSNVINMKSLPIGVNPKAAITTKMAEGSDEDYYRRIQAFSLLLAINFTVWNKYTIYEDGFGDRNSSLIPFLIMAQMSPFKNQQSAVLNNLILGLWFAYYNDGFSDNAGDGYDYSQSVRTMMFGIFATLYLNEFLSMQQSPLLFYFTLKMGLIMQRDKWDSFGTAGSESSTKFGVFPALGVEYFFINQLAAFIALGYNPLGWGEFGLRVRFGK